MPKTREQKKQDAIDYTDKLQRAKGLVFANFDGLKVKDIEILRKQCREQGIDYVVAKKTLMKIAFEKAGIDADPKTLQNSVASVFGYDDEVAPAKIIGEFSKKYSALQPVGGVLENKFIDQQMVVTLSKLPSKDELLAKVVGSMMAPVSGFVGVLSGTLRSLVGTLEAIKQSKS